MLGEEALLDARSAAAADRRCRNRSPARSSARRSARRARSRCCGLPARHAFGVEPALRLRLRARRARAHLDRRRVVDRAASRAVRTKVSRRSDTISPCAQRMPGANGTRQRRMPRLFATSVACSGPAPPNGSSVKSRGSWPRSTETARIARTMLATTMPSMPCAVRSTREAEPLGERRDRLARQAVVERHAAAEQASRREPAEHEVGVGDGRLRAAPAVAGGPGLRAGALRPDLHQAVAIEPRDRAAAGADGVDVERRQPHRKALDPFVERRAGGAVADQRDVGAGAAHVERDDIRHAGEPRHVDRADDARRGSRQRGADRHIGARARPTSARRRIG